jgi:hypothetical protein
LLASSLIQRTEIGDRRLETGDRRLETGDWRPETGKLLIKDGLAINNPKEMK